jgi:hypothetical protein
MMSFASAEMEVEKPRGPGIGIVINHPGVCAGQAERAA